MNSYYSHHVNTYELYSTFVFAAVVFHQTAKVFFITNAFHLIQTIMYSSGFWIFIIFFLIMNSLPFLGFYRVVEEVWAVPAFYMSFGFVMGTLMLMNFVFFKLKEVLLPTVFDFINLNLDKNSSDDCEMEVNEFLKEYQSRNGCLSWLFD